MLQEIVDHLGCIPRTPRRYTVVACFQAVLDHLRLRRQTPGEIMTLTNFRHLLLYIRHSLVRFLPKVSLPWENENSVTRPVMRQVSDL